MKYNFSNEVLLKQLLRSSTSILANYVEGSAGSSKRDFTNYLNHSLKSSKESIVWIQLLIDTNRIEKKEGNIYIKELTELSKIFASSIMTAKNKHKF